MTVAELAKRIKRTRKWTAEMLAEWKAAGVTEEVNGRWRLTALGREYGAGLLEIDLTNDEGKEAA